MPEKKQQHYVPRFYLRNFSIDDLKKAIGLFNIGSQRFVKRASLRSQAYRDYFYGKDLHIESGLQLIDDDGARLVRKIVSLDAPPEEFSVDHRSLLYFILFLRSRTVRAAELVDEMTDKALRKFLSPDPEERKLISKFRFSVRDPVKVAMGVVSGWPFIADLQMKLIVNNTNEVLITSDHPVVFYNQYLEKKGALLSATGMPTKGLQIVVPLSPRHCIMLFDSNVYRIGPRKMYTIETSAIEDISSLNSLQFMNALENVYFGAGFREDQAIQLLRAVSGTRDRSEVSISERGPHRVTSDRIESLVLLTCRDLRCKLSLSFVRLQKKAKKSKPYSAVPPVRNEALCRAFHEFREETEKGRWKPWQFHDFLLHTGHATIQKPKSERR